MKKFTEWLYGPPQNHGRRVERAEDAEAEMADFKAASMALTGGNG